jgi:uncharacterized protein (DUF2236 family)
MTRTTLTPDTVAWRMASDARLLLGSGRALLLQVAHPVVGAGVAEHSDYSSDPWGRLIRTLDWFWPCVYGEDEAAPAAAALRDMHKRIKGVDDQGRRYHALQPEAFAWVHATLVETPVAMRERVARPLRGAERERYYQEMRGVGELYGVRERDLPDDWAGFQDYFDTMVRERLEDNSVVHDVLRTIAEPVRPPVLPLPDGAWRVARFPAAHVLQLATVGLLPPVLRARFGLGWTDAQERELRAITAGMRGLTPLMPRSLRVFGPTYLAVRRRQQSRGREPVAAAA